MALFSDRIRVLEGRLGWELGLAPEYACWKVRIFVTKVIDLGFGYGLSLVIFTNSSQQASDVYKYVKLKDLELQHQWPNGI